MSSAALIVVLPVVLIASALLTPTAEVWAQLWATRLPEMLASTVALLAGVAVLTLVLGAGLAWLVTVYDFPGRKAFGWLLVLPLAMPAYVLGFVFVSLVGYTGPLQTAWRALFGADAWFPQTRSLASAIVVLGLALYPYVYLLARAALSEQRSGTFLAARSLGAGRLSTAWRVVLPLARPSLAAGLALVMMETLTDFATVQYFNVQTVSVGVYRVWKGMFDRVAATELAAVVLLFALAVLAGERLLRGGARYYQQAGSRPGLEPVRLRGWRAAAACAACASVLGAAFVLAVMQLAAWIGVSGVRGVDGVVDPRYVTYFLNSVLVAGVASVGCVALAVLVSNGARLDGGRLTRTAATLTTVGYAVPGPVVAIGTLGLFAGLDPLLERIGVPSGALLVTGSLAGVIYAYVVRFAALAYNGVDASLQKVTPSMTMSAQALGASGFRVVTRVHLPMIRSGIAVALVLVILDAMKELPIVLLLRPFGFDTLSVWVWQLASESLFTAAGLPALTIVAAALVPVAVLARATARHQIPPGQPKDRG